MKHKIMKSVTGITTAVFVAMISVGCGANKSEDAKLPDDVTLTTDDKLQDEALPANVVDEVEELYAIQLNYSDGVAPLMIIPTPVVETIYNAWDDISGINNEKLPILIREYVEPSIVYFDYATDYSVKWNKDNGDVIVEPTDIAAREDYKLKQHK